MEWTTFYVSSVTNAMRGKKLLERNGFTVYMKRSSHQKESEGCGYVLHVNGYGLSAKQLPTNAGVRILRVENGGARL